MKPVRPPNNDKRADVSALQGNRLYTAVPKYLVFTHFLLMPHEMKQAKLIAAFGLEWMNLRQRESLKNEASALTRELAFLDAKARRATASFRRAGALSLERRTSLSPVPTEICLLQAMRTAAMVNHAVSLQAKLGPKSATEFEGLLAYQFAP